MTALFEHLTVVELAGDPAGEMTGKIFAQMGADVVKVEPPTGSPSRSIGPFVRGTRGRRPQPELLVLQHRQAQCRHRRRDAGRPFRAAAPPHWRRHLHHDVAPLRGTRPGARGRAAAHSLAAADRGVGDAVRAHRPVGRSAQLRPRRSRPRHAAQQLWLRRPLDPTDPPGRRPGLPVGVQLRPGRGDARPDRARANGSGSTRRRGDARLPRRRRRTGQPVLVLPASDRPPADLPPRPADTDRSKRSSSAPTTAGCTS